MKKILMLVSLSFIFLISGCKSDEKLELAVSEVTIEYGEVLSLNAEDYLLDNIDKEILENVIVEVGIVNDEGKTEGPIDTDGSDLAVGSYQLSLRYNNEVKTLTVMVQDTTPPTFIDFSDRVILIQGETIDLTQLFKTDDLSEVKVTVEGDVDFNTVGEYLVKFIAIDEYENKTEKECVIQIDEPPKEISPVRDTAGNTSGNIISNENKNNTTSSSSNNSLTNTGSNNNPNGSSGNGSSTGNSNTTSDEINTGSGSSTITQPSQLEPTLEPHQHKFIVNSSATYYEGNELLFDNWNDAVSKADNIQFERNGETFEKWGRVMNIAVFGVRCSNGCGELWYVVELTY